MKDYLANDYRRLWSPSAAFIILWRQGAFLRLSDYWRETMEELQKCTWPTWDELTGSTAVVIVSVGVLGGFTVAVDYLVISC